MIDSIVHNHPTEELSIKPRKKRASRRIKPRKARYVWGAEEIGQELGCSLRQVYHLLECGRVRGAKKVASRWVADLATLELIPDENPATEA